MILICPSSCRYVCPIPLTLPLGPIYIRVLVFKNYLKRLNSDNVYTQSFDGDLFQGYAKVVQIFDEELKAIIDNAFRDNEILFTVYLVLLVVFFHWWLFRQVVAQGHDESKRARLFVARIPSYLLSDPENQTIKKFFALASAPGRKESEATDADN